MNIVDIDKLQKLRSMVDCDISERSIVDGLSIPVATMQFAENELGLKLFVSRSWGSNWCSCFSITATAAKAVSEMSKGEFDSALIGKTLAQKTYISRKPYDAAVAAIVRELDSDCDIVLSKEDFIAHFGDDEILRVITATPIRVEAGDLHEGKYLFESSKQYIKRLQDICALKAVETQYLEFFAYGEAG